MSPKTYSILDKCIENGLKDAKLSIENFEVDPSSEIAQSMIHDAIMKEIELANFTLSVQSEGHQ